MAGTGVKVFNRPRHVAREGTTITKLLGVGEKFERSHRQLMLVFVHVDLGTTKAAEPLVASQLHLGLPEFILRWRSREAQCFMTFSLVIRPK